MSAYIIPVLIVGLVVYSLIKKKNAYAAFVLGAKSSFDLVLLSFPYIVAIFIAIEVFVVSGLSSALADAVAPVLSWVGIPKELCELLLIKPFSGCGSLAILENIYSTYGVDSYLARAGSCIAGSSEAVFYVAAVFFSKTQVTKFRYGIWAALFANLLGAIAACFFVRIL